MNEELKKQIEQEAEDYAIKMAWINKEQIDSQLFYEYIAKTSFRAGVTSHIIRAITAEQENEILREALLKAKEYIEFSGEHTKPIERGMFESLSNEYNNIIAHVDEALTPKQITNDTVNG